MEEEMRLQDGLRRSQPRCPCPASVPPHHHPVAQPQHFTILWSLQNALSLC